MSAPIALNSDQLRQLADFLDDLTAATLKHAVHAGSYNRVDLGIADTVVHIAWNETEQRYTIADSIGD